MTLIKRWVGSLTFQVLLIALASRFMLMLTNWFSLKAIFVQDYAYPKLNDILFSVTNPLSGWSRWDAAHYVRIAMEGYVGPSGEPEQKRGFFPLYPMLMRAFSWLQPGDVDRGDIAIWGVIVANICFVALVVVLAKVIALHFGDEVALTATTLLLVSPMSFFLNAGYSESLFLLCVMTAFWLAYKQQWLPASIAIALASATRLFGLALIPCILLIAWRNKARLMELAMIAVVGTMGAFSFVLWMWIKYDDALAYWHAQSTYWGNWDVRVGHYRDMLFRDPSGFLVNAGDFVIFINICLAILCLATLPWVWMKIEPGLALFTTIIVVFHFLYTWQSLGRYLLAAIGVYIVWAIWLNRPGWNGVRTAVYVSSAILLATLNVLFAHGFWIV
ncbi:MAG: hypothetical protein KC435_13430 [Thermomicrobiales bacterium]|nr:hypothetical protein [Thermomicrobiales bacterium]